MQIASALGAVVWTTCSGGKADLVRSLGAAHVIDYQTQRWAAVQECRAAVQEVVAGHVSVMDCIHLLPAARITRAV
jgi:NADPH:quinone reductase-like Zn-dependent oxidoreductase